LKRQDEKKRGVLLQEREISREAPFRARDGTTGGEIPTWGKGKVRFRVRGMKHWKWPQKRLGPATVS